VQTALRGYLKYGRSTVEGTPQTAGEGLLVQIAQQREEYRQAYELLYRAYRVRGYVGPHPAGIVYRLSYGLPTSRTMVALADVATGGTRVVGTLTIVGDGCLGLPMERDYQREVEQLRDRGRRLAEVSGLAIVQERRSPLLETFYGLTRFLVQYAFRGGIQDLLITVHPRHATFYREWFCFEPCGPCRPCAAAAGNPGIPCRLDLERLAEVGDRRVYANYFDPQIPQERLLRPGMRREDHYYFCCLAGILPEASQPARKVRRA
jgi:hypothetical protein